MAGVFPSSALTRRIANTTFFFASRATRRRAEVGEHRSHAHSSAPRAEVLRGVTHCADVANVVVHIALVRFFHDRPVSVTKEARSRRLQHSAHDPRERPIHNDVTLRLVRLPHELEDDRVPLHAHVPFEQRRDAERLVLACVTLAAHAKESLADETHHRCGHAIARELPSPLRSPNRASRVCAEGCAQAGARDNTCAARAPRRRARDSDIAFAPSRRSPTPESRVACSWRCVRRATREESACAFMRSSCFLSVIARADWVRDTGSLCACHRDA